MGFVADAVGDIGSKVGGVFGFGGGANQYRVNENYAPNIQQALPGAMGNPAQAQFIQALQAQMNGSGPSVAQGMLQRGMDASNANAASQIAGIRGMNPALAARMVADRQAAGTQDLAGQSALLRQREMLNAQGLLGGAIGQQRGQDIAALGTLGGMQQGVNQINAGVAGQNANISSNAWGGLMNGAGSAMGLAFAGGGQVPSTFALPDPMSYIGIQSVPQIFKHETPATPSGAQPNGADSFLTNDMTGGASYFDAGGMVPGRAQVSGDSARNDKVPALLSPGEVVIPRSAADDPEKAAAFVRAIRRQKGPEGGYGAVLAKVRDLKGKLSEIEKMCKGGMVGYAEGGEVKPQPQTNGFGDAVRRMFTRSGPSNSSPSVFDAKSAMDAHNKKLQEAADSK